MAQHINNKWPQFYIKKSSLQVATHMVDQNLRGKLAHIGIGYTKKIKKIKIRTSPLNH